MDTTTALCRGCFRTLDEITKWSRLDDAARQEILAAVDRRRSHPATASRDANQHHV